MSAKSKYLAKTLLALFFNIQYYNLDTFLYNKLLFLFLG